MDKIAYLINESKQNNEIFRLGLAEIKNKLENEPQEGDQLIESLFLKRKQQEDELKKYNDEVKGLDAQRLVLDNQLENIINTFCSHKEKQNELTVKIKKLNDNIDNTLENLDNIEDELYDNLDLLEN